LVTLVGLALLWPVPLGRMPMSADHPVHLTRIYLLAEQIGQGRLAGWSSVWFFGFPIGELYPIGGDLLIIAVHTLGLGLLDWAQSYALGFCLVFLIQGWALLRAGRAFGMGVGPGLVAALLMLCDPGMYREGGWLYTVGYGVWPQALSTALCWLGFGELALAWPKGATTPEPRRLATAGLVLGLALLAHPMAIPTIAMALPLFVLCLGLRRGRVKDTIDAVRGHLGAVLLVAIVAFVVAGFWLVPMLSHRGWMASYGWLFAPLEAMTQRALEGQWSYRMPSAVGYVAWAGLLWAAVSGKGFARFVAAFALTSWVMASADVFWTLRLDRVSEGFTHLQYQRFLLVAKPGLYLAVGGLVGAWVELARRGASDGWSARLSPKAQGILTLFSLAAVVSTLSWLVVDTRSAMAKYEVGKVQTERTDDAQFDADYQEFLAWAAEQKSKRPQFYRIAFKAHRNLHWFMDAPIHTQTPAYKIGFTPGDNFVHKPESDQRELLDALRVRYLVTRRRSRAREVARFGQLSVSERDVSDIGVAKLEGTGQLEVIEDAADQGRIQIRIAGADHDTRLVLRVAGHPRWHLTRDGQPLEWYEAPVRGDGQSATVAQRRAGDLRGGKAGGDDGTEPTLIAVDGATDGEYVLAYRFRRPMDWLANLASLLALALLGLTLLRTKWTDGLSSKLAGLLTRGLGMMRPLTHPGLVGGLLVVILGLVVSRWAAAGSAESKQAVGWMLEGRGADARRMEAAPFKADMLIRSAVRVRARPDKPATVTFPSVDLGETLAGWYAIEDDAAKEPAKAKLRLSIEAREGGGEWQPLLDKRVRHRPDRRPIEITTGPLAGTTVDLRVRVEASAKGAPPFGFDLDLGAAQ
jgi:hypothetical protein